MANNQPPALPGCDEYDPKSLLVDQALAIILDSTTPIGEHESVSIKEAYDRVLAQPITSPINVPAYTNSAMDGYAILAKDIPAEGTRPLKIVTSVFAGKPVETEINSGECVRIMTGAKLPRGADTVVMQEHVKVENDKLLLTSGHKPGQNIRQAGEDLSIGGKVFEVGKYLTPADIGMIASLGMEHIQVFRKVNVAFFSTGDEICEVGKPLADGQIYDSNRYTVMGMLKRLGVNIIDMGIIPDDRDKIKNAFMEAAKQADMLITSGGVSVGEADFVKETLVELGKIGFWKIAMKPGKPLAFGHINQCQFFGLPGNPVSSMVTFYQFVQPAIMRMQGQTRIDKLQLRLKCATALKKSPGRLEYQRGVMYQNEDGELVVRSTGAQGSGLLSSMGQANCFIVLPLESTMIDAGEMVLVQPFAGMI